MAEELKIKFSEEKFKKLVETDEFMDLKTGVRFKVIGFENGALVVNCNTSKSIENVAEFIISFYRDQGCSIEICENDKCIELSNILLVFCDTKIEVNEKSLIKEVIDAYYHMKRDDKL
ncbi:MAG: hypothetical protein N2749_05245 [Clostridia bacterium]|nr:hypothetical protein [Clostridia bacterium]